MNENKFKFLGIDKFHQKGYYGRGITVASREKTISEHGAKVYDVICQVCPEATILCGVDYKTSEINFDVYTTSLFFSSDGNESNKKYIENLYKRNVVMCCAIGNNSDERATKLSEYDEMISVGACDLVNNKAKRMLYSSISENLDFMSLTNIETNLGKFTGSSCATPVFASMIVLIQEFFTQKIGRKLNNQELIEFIKNNCQDLETEGFDKKSGNGIFILPDPDEIDLSKYIDMDYIFDYLKKQNELLEPNYWIIKISEEDKLKWLFIKWANAVKLSEGMPKDFDTIYDYEIEDVLANLEQRGVLLEPNYWREKIKVEDKLKWMFFKWCYAIERSDFICH